MGYGILLAGYLFLFSIPLHAMGVSVEIIGYILLLRALTLLSEYQEEYRRAKNAAATLIPLGAFSLFLQSLLWLGKTELYDAIYAVTELPYTLLLALLLLWFHHHLLRATEIQASEVDLPDLVRQAKRNRIFTFVYFLLAVLQGYLNVPLITQYIPYGMIVSFISLVGVIWLLLNAKMIFTCYVRICLPEDLDMPMHESKIPNPFASIKAKEADPMDIAEEKKKQHEAYDAQMRAMQAAKTKKNKRRKHK